MARTEKSRALLWIAAFKLFKGVLLFVVGVGALRLLHRDVAATVLHWVNVLRADPDNRFVHSVITHIVDIHPNRLREISAGTFIYSALLLTEGIGLVLRKRWAEYFTIITTAGLIPLELYEFAEHPSLSKAIVTIVNAAIVWYLVARVARTRQPAMATG
jgi:uncharacterized membrane protein (DUF2068 family)